MELCPAVLATVNAFVVTHPDIKCPDTHTELVALVAHVKHAAEERHKQGMSLDHSIFVCSLSTSIQLLDAIIAAHNRFEKELPTKGHSQRTCFPFLNVPLNVLTLSF